MKKKSKRNIFSFYTGVYGCTVSVLAGMSVEDGQRYWYSKIAKVNVEVVPTKLELSAALVFVEETKDCCLVFEDVKPCGAVLAHEALHAAVHILRKSGVKFTEESEEAYAYLMDYIILKSAEKLYPERIRGKRS